MNICVEHDAGVLARLTGSPRAACDGIIIPYGRPGEIIASTLRSNPLGDAWLLDVDLPGNRVVTWSGTLASGLFDRHPMTWMPPGHKAFREFGEQIRPQLEAHGRTLCFQPHSRHVLSDVQSCINFAREMQGSPFEIALAPALLLEPEMLKDVEDHLRRAFETLDNCCAMAMLSDVVVSENDDGTWCEPVPLGDGVLPRELIRKFIRDHVPPATPIVISSSKIDQQRQWLQG